MDSDGRMNEKIYLGEKSETYEKLFARVALHLF